MDAIRIRNDGQTIVETNYWDSEAARRGLCYLSTNAGAVRLLVPRGLEPSIPDMLDGARLVAVSRGPLDGRDMLEILFDDGSANPYAIHMSAVAADLLPRPGDAFVFAVWARDGWVADLPGRYRHVPRIPWLKPWDGA